MPTYDYRCNSCSHTFELRQSFQDDPVSSCPKCKQPSRRLFFAPAIIYKGSGFYTTDYKNTHASLPDSSSKNDSSESSSSEASSTDSSKSTSPKNATDSGTSDTSSSKSSKETSADKA
ncbi:MAG: hypothetical protein BZY82_09165 [SAR202 cluster bacterium Io17-Chloro-G3]|nr:MAG: hypothetical protein BZY82_09165 [SAR202 cluster bacterium Io17-Chloro-G3]